MPIVTIDGQQYSVDSNDPDAIQKAVNERKKEVLLQVHQL